MHAVRITCGHAGDAPLSILDIVCRHDACSECAGRPDSCLIVVCVDVQVGEFVMVGLGYALPAWQHLVLAAACINAAILLLYPLVSESARWLLSHGRTEEATAIMQRVATGNKSSMPCQPIVSSVSSEHLQRPQELSAEEGVCGQQPAGGEDEAPLGLCQLLRERRLAIRLIVILINWFSLMLNYYGIAMGSGGIPGSM